MVFLCQPCFKFVISAAGVKIFIVPRLRCTIFGEYLLRLFPICLFCSRISRSQGCFPASHPVQLNLGFVASVFIKSCISAIFFAPSAAIIPRPFCAQAFFVPYKKPPKSCFGHTTLEVCAILWVLPAFLLGIENDTDRFFNASVASLFRLCPASYRYLYGSTHSMPHNIFISL